jgi:hypothetical protein
MSCLAGPVRLLFSFPTNRWPLLALTINKPVLNSLLGARILKHLVEAKKLAFLGELSFQRSECTADLTVATFLCVDFKDYFE